MARKKELPDTPFQRFLESIEACREAREWVGKKTAAQAWKAASAAAQKEGRSNRYRDWQAYLLWGLDVPAKVLVFGRAVAMAAYDHETGGTQHVYDTLSPSTITFATRDHLRRYIRAKKEYSN